MTEENAQSEGTEGLEAVEGVTGDDIGLAPDFFQDPEGTETSEAATGADEELSQESDEQSTEDEGGAATSDGPTPEAPAEGQAEEAEVTDTQEQPQTFYKYGDHEFGTPDEVTQYLKTVEGRQRVTQVAHQDALVKNDAWVEWSKDPVKLREHLAKLEGHNDPAKVEVTEKKKTFLDGADWNRLRGLVEQGRGMEALATMADMFDQVLETRLSQVESKLESKVAPFADRQAAQEATVSLFKRAENAMDSDGNLLWPEFNPHSEQFDPQFCQLFSQVWEKLPANIAWDDSGYGIELGYARTKALVAQRQGAASPETPAEGGNETETKSPQDRARNAARDAQGRFVKQTEDAATSVGGSGATPPPTQGPSESYQEAALLQSMDRADKDRDPVFGIRR